MYTPEEDALVELPMLPQSALESPDPLVLAMQGRLFVAYVVRVERPVVPPLDVEQLVTALTSGVGTEAGDDVTEPEVRRVSEPAALVEFRGPVVHAFQLDPYAVERHPLAGCGLLAHAAFEVRGSSWLASLPAAEGRHFVVTFQGAVFECIATGVRMTLLDGMEHVLPEVHRRLQQRSGASARTEAV